MLRTFSKVYGMAGLRAGFALGRPDLLAKLRSFGVGFMPAHRNGLRHRESKVEGPGGGAARHQ